MAERRGMRPVSPIVSPPRASRDSAFDNDSASLPSYRSSATRQSEKYSTLMRYLDGVADGSSGVDASASLSTISASPAPSMAGSAVTAKSRRQFVWDEDPEAMPIHAGPIDSSLSVTYFSLHEDGPGSAAGSLESKVADVKAKVQGMKAELRQRNDLAKQLQSDFARVKAAKERQDQKSREAADKRLGEVRAGHQDSIRQQQALVDKIQKDVKALEEKEAKLLAKLDKLRGDMDASVEAARADVRRGRRREVQQWEADEARSTAKLVASRVDAMHKSAAQALAPELERIVAEGRDALSRREAEADAARRVLAESLRAEGDKKFGEFQKLCRERYSGADGDRRGGLVAETRLQEARSRHEGERVAVIEQFQRERRLVDDEMERSRQVLNDNHGLLLKSIQDAHVQKVNEMTSSHGRERSLLMEQLVADRESLSKELDRDREQYFQSLRDRISRLQAAARETAALESERAVEGSLAEIMDKLQLEVRREREQTQSAWEEELDTLRAMYEKRVRDADARANRYRSAAEHSLRLRNEVDGLRIEDMESRRQLEGEKRNRNRSVDQLEAARQRAASVKTVRIDGEESVYSRSSGRSKGRHDEASIDDDIFNLSPDNSVRSRRTLRSDQYSGLIAEKENEEMNWARQALESSSRLKAMQSEHSEAVRAMEERSNDELSRIQEKISLVTRRRQATLLGLQDELRELQTSNRELQAVADSRRDSRVF